MTTKLNLAQKIAQASNAVGALETDKTNTQGNYKYISADKILERAGNALADAGVAVVPGISHVEVATGTTSGNKPRFDVSVYMKMIVTDGETTIEQPWLGMGSDYSVPDKATYKAITSGHKYFLAKLLNVGVGNEDPEHEPAQEPAPVTHVNGNGKPAGKSTAKPQAEPAAEDNPFDGPEPDTVSSEMAAEIDELGATVYGDAWAAKQAELAEHVSKGSAKKVAQLMRSEAELLLSGLKKRADAQKQPAQSDEKQPA